MKKTLSFCLLTIMLPSLAGCGGGSSEPPPPPVYSARIYSDQPSDGDISYDSLNQIFTINNAPSSLNFGIDEVDQNLPEYRAFLDFPLDGTTGYDAVPASVGIVSAFMKVYVNEVSFATEVPTLVELVTYSLSGLQTSDFDSLPLLSRGVSFFSTDPGTYVAIDVTAQMSEAQRRGLRDLQLRLLLDLTANHGFVSIDDQHIVLDTAPQLTVRYVY